MNITPPPPIAEMPENAQKVFSGVLFDVYQWPQELFDGTTTPFEKLKRPSSVVIVPITKEGTVVLLHEQQPASNAFVGLPAGEILLGEKVEDAAIRELLEETGYQAETLELWTTVQPSSRMEWVIYVLIARNCQKIGEQNLDSGEKIKLQEVSVAEFVHEVLKPGFRQMEVAMQVLRLLVDSSKLENVQEILCPSPK